MNQNEKKPADAGKHSQKNNSAEIMCCARCKLFKVLPFDFHYDQHDIPCGTCGYYNRSVSGDDFGLMNADGSCEPCPHFAKNARMDNRVLSYFFLHMPQDMTVKEVCEKLGCSYPDDPDRMYCPYAAHEQGTVSCKNTGGSCCGKWAAACPLPVIEEKPGKGKK